MAKGGTSSSNTQIPAYLEDAVRENINRARDVSQIGYVPYYGADVAAFSPMQQQSMLSTGNAASAFGLAPQGFDAMAGMPEAQTFAGGVQGYSSAPLFEQSLDKLFANAPAQYRAMNDMFIDPFTGARSRNNYGNASPVMGMARTGNGGVGGGGETPFQFPQDQTSDAEIFGVNRAYNPYKYSMPTEDISGDGVVDYRDMSFGEGGRRDVPMSERIVNGVFGGPLRAADFLQGSLFDMSGAGDSTMTPEQSMQIINDGAARYNRLSADRGFNPNSLGYQYDQRGDMYPSQIQGGLLGNDTSAGFLESGQQFVDQLSEQEKANLIQQNTLNARLAVEANERAQAENQRNIAAAQEAAIEAARAAAAERARIAAAQRSTINSSDGDGPKGNNSSGGYGKSQAPGEAGSRFGL